jgi:hypothetical protein
MRDADTAAAVTIAVVVATGMTAAFVPTVEVALPVMSGDQGPAAAIGCESRGAASIGGLSLF